MKSKEERKEEAYKVYFKAKATAWKAYSEAIEKIDKEA